MKKRMLMAAACLLLSGSTVLALSESGNENQPPAKSTGSRITPENEVEQSKPHIYKTNLANSKGSQVIITMFNSDVQVIGHNASEVVIEAKAYEAPPARAAGLKPLYNQVEDNTGMGLSITKTNNTLKVDKASRQEGSYIIRVPKNVSVIYHETNWTGSDLNLSAIEGEIELKLNNGKATLTNITGPVVANTTSSDLVIKFSSLNQSKPSAISTVAGTVDIHLPANTKADFKLKTVQGEIYSDFDLNLPKATKSNLPRVTGGNNIEGKTNGGGVEMTLYTISGDMFIRKTKK